MSLLIWKIDESSYYQDCFKQKLYLQLENWFMFQYKR